MLFIVCALTCEARPFISHFRLKPLNQPSPFPIYFNSSLNLIITGVGKIQTAAAMGYLQGLKGDLMSHAWLNIGIAGHADFALGEGILAHQIVDQSSGQRFYPLFVIDRPVSTATIWTIDKPETSYQDPVVYDMEASAFWNIASRFTTAELIHCYKVISDNKQSTISCLTKPKVEELMGAHLSRIENFIQSLQHLSHSLLNLEISEKEIKPFLDRWHFTNTQQIQLKRLLQRWQACTGQSTSLLWNPNLVIQSKSKQVLLHLEKELQNLSFQIGKENV